MEVHAHTHTERKKWTHYLWEFLMLFLAVFCGFLAENVREHVIEKNRENQYIKSFVEDLETDTADYIARIAACDKTISISDSSILLLNRPDRDKWANEIYFFLRQLHRSDVFEVNDRTIIQLRNAGGMRLISNKSVSDSMVDYYKVVEHMKFIYEEQIDHKRSLRSLLPEMLDGIDYGKVVNEENLVVRVNDPLKLRVTDPTIINSCTIVLQNIKGINQGIKRRLIQMKKKANLIREYILKEYHLE
jgi:hypothetical protein